MKQAHKILDQLGTRVPRYTSYPTVPQWKDNVDGDTWINHVSSYFDHSNKSELSIYIHLPFCEDLCTYCGCNKRITKNHSVELPYVDSLIEEWETYRSLPGFQNARFKKIHLGGGTPTFFSAENLVKLISTLKDSAAIADGFTGSFEAHPANTTKEHLDELYKLGFDRVSLGIQDFEKKVQFLINRYQTENEVREISQLARKIGYSSINFDVVYGLPGQTVGSLKNTIQQVIDLDPDRIAYYSYAHVPWMHPGQRRYTEEDIPPMDMKSDMLQLGIDMFKEAGYNFIGMDHFAKPKDKLSLASEDGTLYRDFMGYSETPVAGMIGLGVSSISYMDGCYAQNIKTVEDYQKSVQDKGNAVFRGHMLNEEEKVTARIIHDVMCHRNIMLNDLPESYLNRYLDKATELKNYGLIYQSDNSIFITEYGRKYLRNIASVFDPYFKANSSEKLYSKAL